MILKYKMCGGDLAFIEDGQLAICLYCGTKQTLSKMDDEKKPNLYEQANH